MRISLILTFSSSSGFSIFRDICHVSSFVILPGIFSPWYSSVANLLPEFSNVSGSHLFNTAPATSGRNSNRSFIPIPAARRCSVRIDGLAFPLSSLLISPCAIPVRSDNSFCVNPDCCRASMMACMIACSGWRASYSFLNFIEKEKYQHQYNSTALSIYHKITYYF